MNDKAIRNILIDHPAEASGERHRPCDLRRQHAAGPRSRGRENLRNCCRRYGDEAAWAMHQVAGRGAESYHGAVGGRMAPALPGCQHSGGHRAGL